MARRDLDTPDAWRRAGASDPIERAGRGAAALHAAERQNQVKTSPRRIGVVVVLAGVVALKATVGTPFQPQASLAVIVTVVLIGLSLMFVMDLRWETHELGRSARLQRKVAGQLAKALPARAITLHDRGTPRGRVAHHVVLLDRTCYVIEDLPTLRWMPWRSFQPPPPSGRQRILHALAELYEIAAEAGSAAPWEIVPVLVTAAAVDGPRPSGHALILPFSEIEVWAESLGR